MKEFYVTLLRLDDGAEIDVVIEAVDYNELQSLIQMLYRQHELINWRMLGQEDEPNPIQNGENENDFL